MNGPDSSFEAARATLTGDRSSNQDRCLVLRSDETVLLGLADGLGGHPRGDVAAQLLVDVCESMFRQAPKPLYDPERFMLQCIGKAHHSILRFGRRQQPPSEPRTTAVLAVVQAGVAYWAHVGDSRLYLLREGRVLFQTQDHTQVQFVRQNADEASRPHSKLTRCLGGLSSPPTTTCGTPTLLQKNDTIVLCSDGLWGQVPAQRMIEDLEPSPAALASGLQRLVEHAVSMPNSDNVTAVALRWLADPSTLADQALLAEPPSDPQLEQAIRHLASLLEKSGEPKR